jgi:uncharacterized damage-inducible protein DinB
MGYSQLEIFSRTRRRTLELTAGLSQEQIDYAPAPGQWCLAEILDHVIRTDRIFRREFEQLVALKRQGKRAFLFRSLADFDFVLPAVPRPMLRLLDVPLAFFGVVVPKPVRQAIARLRSVPAKAPKIIKPEKGRTAAELRGELKEMLGEVEQLFAENAELPFGELYYYNPLTGFTTLPGILSFTASHESRHQEQMQELLAVENFPPSRTN